MSRREVKRGPVAEPSAMRSIHRRECSSASSNQGLKTDKVLRQKLFKPDPECAILRRRIACLMCAQDENLQC